jgi:hydrogenase-4 component F
MFIIIFLVASVVMAAAAYLIKIKNVSYGIVALHTCLLIALNVHEFFYLNQLEADYFESDYLSIIFLSILSIISITTQIHAYIYNEKRQEYRRNVAVHNMGFIIFVTAMAAVCVAQHVGLLWAFVEMTTLSASVLIYHDRNLLALEGTWKYIFVCSIGIALAFGGILFLGVAIQEAHLLDFSILTIKAHAKEMNPIWLKVCFGLILTGFSVKMGIVPLFNVDIDAKDVSPSPIGAMFSSCLMNVGFISIFRFYECFTETTMLGWMNNVLMISGVLSIFLASTYLLKVSNYKRAFAYSSMEHAGIAIIALASGHKLGYFACILHLILHSFTKASLFYQFGQVYRVFNTKYEQGVGGYFKINPLGGLVLLLGMLSILALPPFGLFISEFMIFRSLALSNHWAVLLLVVVLLSFIVFSLSKKFIHLLFGNANQLQNLNINKHIHPAETFSQFLLLGLVMYVGMAQPDFLVFYINKAIEVLGK